MATIRITQQRVETIAHSTNVGMRVTQHAVEELDQPNNTQAMLCTQHVIEILLGPATAYTDGGFTVAPYAY